MAANLSVGCSGCCVDSETECAEAPYSDRNIETCRTKRSGYWYSAVAGVGVKDQLRVRNVLLQDVRVDGVNDHVVVAVDHQRRLLDGVQVLVRLLARRAPLGQGLALRRRDLLVHLRVSVLTAQAEALSGCCVGGPPGLGGREGYLLPQQVLSGVGGAD